MLIYTKKRKKGIPIKAKYTEEANIKLNKLYNSELDKFQIKPNIKLVTNDIKVALIIVPTSLITGILNPSMSAPLYIVSGCSLSYAITKLYQHKKEKQKKFTLK